MDDTMNNNKTTADTETMGGTEVSDSSESTAAMTEEITDELEYNTMDDLSYALGKFISSNSSTFTCGGAIPVADIRGSSPDRETILTGRKDAKSKEERKQSKQEYRAKVARSASSDSSVLTAKDSASPPVILRWDSPDGQGTPIQFPLTEQETSSFEKLVQACTPAGFGRGGENVMDSSYRTAVKMDSSKFSTSLCPYSLGIMDKVTNMLLPNVTDVGREGITPRRIVVAELYKLNIYQGPSGFFKSHVDTPRKNTQFGSLVICLPCPHQGGRLTVKHGGHEIQYDWDKPETAATVQWAAFYSDCEHEVHKVTDGHRVTLTYNLYSESRPWDLTNHLGEPPAPVQITNLPLHKKMQELLGDEHFMSAGGVLGVYSSYAYPYSPNCDEVPQKDYIVLKGSDMALCAVFHDLGLNVKIRPVMPDSDELFNRNGYDRDMELAPLVGHVTPGQLVLTERGGDDSDDPWEWMEEEFGQSRPDITWITNYKWRGLGMIHLTYGNQAGIDCAYAYNALLVEIPPASHPSSRGCRSP